MLRFPRRYPLSLLVLLIPLAIFLYINFSQVNAWAGGRLLPLQPSADDTRPTITPTDGLNDTVPTSSSEVLLVSALFPLSASKHAAAHDASALLSLMSQLTAEIYFFTPPALSESVQKARGARPLTLDTRFDTLFDVPPLSGREAEYEKMRDWDRDKSRARVERATEVYASSATKAFFLAEALRQVEDGQYKYAFWIDVDDFMASPAAFAAWPDLARLEKVWDEGAQSQAEGGTAAVKGEELMFVPVHRLPDVSMQLWNENLGPVKNDFSRTSFFGGPPAAVRWWESTYFAYLDLYLSQRLFVGDDATLVNSLLLLHPDRIITVWQGDPFAPAAVFRPLSPYPITSPRSLSPKEKATLRILGDCGDPASYYQFFLASEREQAGARATWDSEWHFWSPWPGDWDWEWEWDDWAFWKEEWQARRRRESCRVTKTLAVLPTLRRLFGKTWKAPGTSVHS